MFTASNQANAVYNKCIPAFICILTMCELLLTENALAISELLYLELNVFFGKM